MSTRDGRAFCDQLAVPPSFRAYLGRLLVAAADLLSPPPCESGALAASGLTTAELDALAIDGPLGVSATHLIPLNNTFPMGFGWSSRVAQATIVHACMHMAGFRLEQFVQ